MKSKFSYKSKRTIIIAAIITVLLAGTATGVYFFTKGNAQAQAAGDNNTTQEQYGEAPEENKNEQQNNTTENEQNKNEQGETTPNQQEEQETERQEQTTNNNQTTQNEQTTTTTTGEVPNQEYVTEREETVKNPWETLEVGWGPTQFASIASTANLTAKKSNLEIHKTVDKESVKIGDTLTYTISVKNNGDKVAKAIIYDNVPEGTVLLNKDNNEDENTKKLTWRVTVEPGETENVEFTVRVKAEKGTIKNSAIVNGKTTNETETGIINITGKKEVNTSEAKAGDTLTYTITLTNSGNATGTVTVTDEIPAGTTLVEKSITNNGVESNGTITWTDVEVKAGKTAEVSFKVTINSDTKTSVTNKAVIDGNKPTEEVETKVANITGVKSVDKSTAKVGDTLTYTIKLTNSGNGDGKVTVTDEIPTGTTLVADSITANGSYNEENKTITWTDVKVEAGKTAEVSFKATINSDTKTSVTNKAVIDGNKPTEEVETKVANITGVKSVDKSTAKVGDTLTYTIKLTNSGNGDGKVTVTDEIPTGTRIKDENTTGYNKETNTMTWSNVEVKANGGTATLTLEVVVKDDTTDTVKNVAKIDNKEIPEKPETKVANITGAKSVDKPTAKVGDILTYTIKLTNSGNGDGKVTVTDEIPTGTRIKDENTTGYNKETNTMTWSNVEVKANGGTATLTLEVVVKDDTTDTVKNVAKIDNKEIPEKPETKVANITGTKKVDKTEAKVGDTLTYTITLTNSGNATGTVTVTDPIPEGTKIKVATTDGYDLETNTMTWKNVEVKAGKSVELTLEVVVEDNTSVIKNKAYVDDNKIPEEPETAVKHHYTVEHYTENLDGTYSKVEKDTVVSEDVEIGTKVTYEANKYDGFTFDDSKTENKDATVPDNNNLVVKLYYTRRNDLSYTVYYKEQGTENELADAKVVDGQKFGDVVTENAIDINGYNKVNPTSAEITITTGKNEYTFYYTKRADLSYTVYYKEQGTETKLAEAKVVNNKTFEEVITASIKAEDNATEKPKTIDGYECVEVKPGELSIGTGENVITFYYVKLCQYKIEYYLNGNLAEQYTVGPEKIRVGTTIGFETKTEELEKIDSAISGYKYIKYVGVDGKDNEGTTAYKDMNVIKVYYGLPVTSIEKTATEFVNAGDEIEYTIEVSNTGDWKTTITVTDTLEETEYVNGSSNITPSIDGKTLSWSIELEARGSKTISFRAKTNNESYGDEISNTAKIKGTNKEDTAVTRVNEIDVTYSEWLEGQKGTDLNIVFVLDNSSSMNFPIAGKTYVKDELNRKGSHVTPIAPSDKDKTRIENAKSAINSFIDSQANNKNTTMEVVTFNKSEKGTAKNMMTLMDIPDKDIQYRENLWGGYYYIEINGIECRVEKDVIGTDGKKHCGVYIPIDYGARLVGDNSVSNDILKKNVSEISISSEQNGFGTYVEPAFKLINDNKEKQYLKDGKKNIIIVLADGKFSDNNSYNGELKTLKDTLETNGGEIYCVGFGSGTEYDSTALAKMSTNNKCYEAKDASTLLTKFNEILASVGKTQSGRTQNGKITFEEAKNTIKVSEECPIVATYGDSENETVLFTCTSDNADEMWNKYGLKIDGKIISWDAKQFAIANEGIKVPNNIKIKYYIARQ